MVEPSAVGQHRRHELGRVVRAEIAGVLRHLDLRLRAAIKQRWGDGIGAAVLTLRMKAGNTEFITKPPTP